MVACSAAEMPASDPPAAETVVDRPTGDAGIGADSVVVPDDGTSGTGNVTQKTDGEPEIQSWGWLAITKENLFPTYLTGGLSNIGHLARDIVIKNPSNEKKRFILRAALQGFTTSETPVTIDLGPGETKSFWADSALDYEGLSKLSSPTDSAITVTLSSTTGAIFYSANAAVKVLPKNQVFWKGAFNNSTVNGKFPDGTLERIAVVGAMTTPHDKDGYVDSLLQQAAQLTATKSLSGYQRIKANTTLKDASEIVHTQANAIYAAMHNMGVNYTSITQDFFSVNGQNVRFPAESLRAKTANCIDGSLVFASAFEALGIDSDIVFVPGHAFVAVHLGPPGHTLHDTIFFIETTVVANTDYTNATKIGHDNFNGKYANNSLRVPLSAVREQYKFLPYPF